MNTKANFFNRKFTIETGPDEAHCMVARKQCKDIPTLPLLLGCAAHPHFKLIEDENLQIRLPDGHSYPRRLARAKLRRLNRKGWLRISTVADTVVLSWFGYRKLTEFFLECLGAPNALTDKQKLNSPVRRCIFFREGMFYPLDLPEATIADNAIANPGTLKVEDAITGEILWQPTS